MTDEQFAAMTAQIEQLTLLVTNLSTELLQAKTQIEHLTTVVTTATLTAQGQTAQTAQTYGAVSLEQLQARVTEVMRQRPSIKSELIKLLRKFDVKSIVELAHYERSKFIQELNNLTG